MRVQMSFTEFSLDFWLKRTLRDVRVTFHLAQVVLDLILGEGSLIYTGLYYVMLPWRWINERKLILLETWALYWVMNLIKIQTSLNALMFSFYTCHYFLIFQVEFVPDLILPEWKYILRLGPLRNQAQTSFQRLMSNQVCH